jgi:predicted DNA-binding transcriptional regulator AlpA
MPRPVVDRGANRAKLWLREEIMAWKKKRTANSQS